jgi:hypothetical protein
MRILVSCTTEISALEFVIPAKAGIHTSYPSEFNLAAWMDARLRGHDVNRTLKTVREHETLRTEPARWQAASAPDHVSEPWLTAFDG